jgi:Cu+-exporting ATPase
METTTETSVFRASGISCQGCAGTIRDALRSMGGVVDVTVDVAQKTVSVKHDVHVRDEQIAGALEQAGYPASKVTGESSCCGGGQKASCCSAPVQIAAKAYTVKDPVCGMDVDPAHAAGSSTHAGTTYFFCSTSCKRTFDGNPSSFAGAGSEAPARESHGDHSCCATGSKSTATTKDPVCGMDVDPETAAGSHEHRGETYSFCSKGCLEKFRTDPEKYLRARHAGDAPHATAAPAAEGVTYTCPMHPEVIRDKPGSCPICGMALEPMTATGDDANPELEDMTRRFWACALLSAPMLLVMAAEVLLGHDAVARVLPGRSLAWAQFLLATPVVLWGGYPFFERGWASLVNRSLNMFTLIAIGTGAAYLYSVVATVVGVDPTVVSPGAI